MRKSAVLLPIALLLLAICSIYSCGRGNGAGGSDSDSTSHALPDTLRVGTLYSPTSYFIYREEQMGYDYDMVTRFGADKGIAIDLHVAPSLTSLVEMLDSGIIDLAAYEIPITAEYKPHVVAAGDENITTQVLVQPKSDNPITDVTQLAGREVYVEAGSKYLYRLENLDEAFDIGVEDYLDSGAICFLEWPERIADILPDDTVRVDIAEQPDGSRLLTVTTPDE